MNFLSSSSYVNRTIVEAFWSTATVRLAGLKTKTWLFTVRNWQTGMRKKDKRRRRESFSDLLENGIRHRMRETTINNVIRCCVKKGSLIVIRWWENIFSFWCCSTQLPLPFCAIGKGRSNCKMCQRSLDSMWARISICCWLIENNQWWQELDDDDLHHHYIAVFVESPSKIDFRIHCRCYFLICIDRSIDRWRFSSSIRHRFDFLNFKLERSIDYVDVGSIYQSWFDFKNDRDSFYWLKMIFNFIGF